MYLKSIAAFAIIAATMSCSQTRVISTPAPVYSGSEISATDLKNRLTILASAEMEGRETGTAGQRKAADYIEKEFARMGLEPIPSLGGYQQFYPLHKDSLLSASFTVNNSRATSGVEYLPALTYSRNVDVKATEIVFAGYGIEDAAYSDYTGLNPAGKIVVIMTGEPKKNNKYFINADGSASTWTYNGLPLKIAAAKNKGAVAVLVLRNNNNTFPKQTISSNQGTGFNFYSLGEDIDFPVAYVNKDYINSISANKTVATDMLAKATAGEAITDHPFINGDFAYSTKTMRTSVDASNILGMVKGAVYPNEYVFVTAHYDHLGRRGDRIFYGADDDGSGTVGVIEMAEAFMEAKQKGILPKRSVVFMAVSGEEKGLWGSEYYSDHPVFPLDKTSADLNIDMVGRVDTERKLADTLNYVYVVGHDKLSSDLQVINEAANKATSNLTLDYKFDDPNDPNRIYYRSDHYNFARKGVPVLFFYDGMLKADYHKTSDTVDKINFALFKKRIDMIYRTTWDIANRASLLTRDIPLSTGTR